MAALLFAVAGLGPLSPEAFAQTYKAEFKNSLVVGPSGPWGEAAVRFADLLEERTQGRINLKNYFAGQLFAGKQTNEFTLLVQGVADFAFGSTINWSPQVKELNLFAMPFLYPSSRALDAVQDGEPGQRLHHAPGGGQPVRGGQHRPGPGGHGGPLGLALRPGPDRSAGPW